MQPYNTLLSMSTLAEVSSGILLLQNEVLHSTCTHLLGIKHPGFKVRLDCAEALRGAWRLCCVDARFRCQLAAGTMQADMHTRRLAVVYCS